MYCSKEEPKGADCLEAFQAMQDCMKDFPELYEKENEGVGEREANTDSDDKLKEQDIQSESNDSVPKPSNASDAEILTEQTRTSSPVGKMVSTKHLVNFLYNLNLNLAVATFLVLLKLV